MRIEFRPAAAEDMQQFGELAAYVYGGEYGDGPENLVATETRPEWTLCAFDGSRLVSSFSTIPFTMRANGVALPIGGVSAIGTLPEYRRRGLVRRIMTQAFAEMREGGRPTNGLKTKSGCGRQPRCSRRRPRPGPDPCPAFRRR